jgi:hypothetical protein
MYTRAAADLHFLQDVLAQTPQVDVDLHRDEYGRTGLMKASKHNNMEAVSALLDFKADLNAREDYGNTCLNEALKVDEYEIASDRVLRYETAILLLKRGADVNTKNDNEEDALYWCMKGMSIIGSFAMLCCGSDADNAKMDRTVNTKNIGAAITQYKDTQDFIATSHHVLKETLSMCVEVDTRIGVGGRGIQQEPLKRTLEYLGLSLNHDQVVNTSIDDTLRKRVLLPRNPENAKHWVKLLGKEKQWRKLSKERDSITKKMEAVFQ